MVMRVLLDAALVRSMFMKIMSVTITSGRPAATVDVRGLFPLPSPVEVAIACCVLSVHVRGVALLRLVAGSTTAFALG